MASELEPGRPNPLRRDARPGMSGGEEREEGESRRRKWERKKKIWHRKEEKRKTGKERKTEKGNIIKIEGRQQ